jgi:hypothetical protein
MKWLLSLLALIGSLLTAEANESELTELARLVEREPGRKDDVLARLQKSIDAAKAKLAAHQTIPPEEIRKRFAAESLKITAETLHISDVATQTGPLEIVRLGHQFTFTFPAQVVGHPAQSMSLDGSQPDTAAFLDARLGALRDITLKLAEAPPACAEIADTTPTELLERGRRNIRTLGDAASIGTGVSLETEDKLEIGGMTATCHDELSRWIKETVEAVRDLEKLAKASESPKRESPPE